MDLLDIDYYIQPRKSPHKHIIHSQSAASVLPAKLMEKRQAQIHSDFDFKGYQSPFDTPGAMGLRNSDTA